MAHGAGEGKAEEREEGWDKNNFPERRRASLGEGEGGGRARFGPSLEGHADMQGESRRPEGSDRSVIKRMLVEGIAHRADTSTTGEAPDI